MNKFLVLSLAAVALMSSCSSDEVLESVEKQAISFENPFVDKSTRATSDLTTTNIKAFYVYAAYTDNGSTANPKDVYTNTAVTKTSSWAPAVEEYWVPGKDYRFIGYANGTESLSSGVEFNQTTGALSIKDYVVSTKDLVVSNLVKRTNVEAKAQDPVNLTFNHILSKVKFTFASGFSSTTKMTITDLQFTAETKGDYTTTSQWTTAASGSVKNAYQFNTSGFSVTGGQSTASEENYVLPQSNKELTASFNVVVTDKHGNIIGSKEFTGISLKTGGNSVEKWAPNFRYNYTATINAKNIDLNAKPIEFTVTGVTDWTENTPNPTPTIPEVVPAG